jgi:hypothetical protein
VTNASGVVTATLSSANVGSRTVTATIGATPITDDATVNFVAGPIASFTWSVDGAATAGVGENVTLTAKDAQGHTVTNFTGAVSLNTTSGGVGDAVVQWASGTGLGSLTNNSGDAATYNFVAGDNGSVTLQITDTRAETITLSAVSGGPTERRPTSWCRAMRPTWCGSFPATIRMRPPAGGSDDRRREGYRRVRKCDERRDGEFQRAGGGGSLDAISGGGVDTARLTAADGTAACDVDAGYAGNGQSRPPARVDRVRHDAVF